MDKTVGHGVSVDQLKSVARGHVDGLHRHGQAEQHAQTKKQCRYSFYKLHRFISFELIPQFYTFAVHRTGEDFLACFIKRDTIDHIELDYRDLRLLIVFHNNLRY
jgi:hypothetical protein